MKKLTKGLSLVLVLVLVFSLVGTAFASGVQNDVSYIDCDEFDYDEAIYVLTGLGIINGFEDGSLQPDGDFTRAQAAKILSYMLNGAAASKFVATEAPYEDVAVDHWAAGYIADGTEDGIIAGYGNGKFGPEDTLTGTQWLKMLLVAVGYDAEKNGFVNNANWENNVKKIAVSSGMIEQADLDLLDEFDREIAIYYAWKALNYTKRTPVTTVVADADVAAYLNGVEFAIPGLSYKVTVTVNTDSIGQRVFGLKAVTFTDPFGRVFVQYTAKDFDKPVYTVGAKRIGSATKKVDVRDILLDAGYSKAQVANAQFVAYEDGVEIDVPANPGPDGYKVGGNGTLTEVYKTCKPHVYRVIVINTYFGQITDVVPPMDKYNVGYTMQPVKDSGPEIEVDSYKFTTKEESEFAVGDVVYYNIGVVNGDQTILANSITKADVVTGQIHDVAANAGSFKIGDNTYELNRNEKINDDQLKIHLADYSNMAVYFGPYGYAGVMERVALNEGIAFVYGIKASVNYSASATNLFADGSSCLAQARVYNFDENQFDVVPVATVRYRGTYYYADVNGQPSTLPVTAIDVWNDSIPVVKDEDMFMNTGFYKYVQIGDSFVFTEKVNTGVVISKAHGEDYASAVVTVGNGMMTLKSAQSRNANNYYANANTTLTVAKIYADEAGTNTTSVYKGWKNFPALETQFAAVIFNERDPMLIDHIYAIDWALEDYTYGVYLGCTLTDKVWNTSNDRFIFKVAVDGIIKEYYADGSAFRLLNLQPGNVVKFRVYTDNLSSGATFIKDVELLKSLWHNEGVVTRAYTDQYIVIDDDRIGYDAYGETIFVDDEGNIVDIHEPYFDIIGKYVSVWYYGDKDLCVVQIHGTDWLQTRLNKAKAALADKVTAPSEDSVTAAEKDVADAEKALADAQAALEKKIAETTVTITPTTLTAYDTPDLTSANHTELTGEITNVNVVSGPDADNYIWYSFTQAGTTYYACTSSGQTSQGTYDAWLAAIEEQTDAVKEAEEGLEDAQETLEDAQEALEEAQADYEAEIADAVAAIEEAQAAIDANAGNAGAKVQTAENEVSKVIA